MAGLPLRRMVPPMSIYLQTMRSFELLALMAASLFCGSAQAGDFDSELLRSGFVHTPLRSDESRSLQAQAESKPVLKSMPLTGEWRVSGEQASLDRDSLPVLNVNFDTGSRRAQGPAGDPDYALYGHAVARLDLGGVNLNAYNRLCLEIEPHCPGLRVVNINLWFDNRYNSAAGYNQPTGAHLIQLKNDTLNRCYLEVADLQRDCVESINLSVSVNGRDLPSAAMARYIIHSVAAQRVESPEKVSGWLPDANRIIYSTTGYETGGAKNAIVSEAWAGSRFELIDCSDGSVACSGKVKAVKTTIGRYGVIDFGKFDRPGRYRLECRRLVGGEFDIKGPELWRNSCWKVLNFIFGMRCGYAVPGVHSRCHADLFSVHNGLRRSFAGGWHDAGDLSQQTLQTADVVYSLLELYDCTYATDPLLAARLREEALWGLDFVLRNRMGDGYHASSMGLLIWQDGIVDSHDDIHSVRVQNCAYDNFLYAAYEAYAARVLARDGSDPQLCDYLGRIAAEDYEFAQRQFAESGYGGWINPYEHTYNTGQCQWEATVSWAATQLYLLTGHERYAADARRHAEYVMDCQQTEPLAKNAPYGFFFRDSTRRSVLHYIHQSREQLIMQALCGLCDSQPGHSDCSRWRSSVAAYGGYIKSLMKYSSPYGMIPAGMYRAGEAADSAAFYSLHLFPPADAASRYDVQIAKGVEVAPGWYVKRFPVWFNIFNGNLAVHTSMGKAAALCGRCLGDDSLLEIAREQLYWTVGKNPFAQSLIYGEGERYPSLNNFSSGELVGAMPVGIRSLGDSDEPYWPNINNACYKEVWLTSAGKWLSLVAEMNKKSHK